jgi:lysozyme family protein
MVDFKTAFTKTMKAEGGYANAPTDKGSETWRGISRAMNPTWEGWNIVDRLRMTANFPDCLWNDATLNALVEQFYRSEYWDKIKGDYLTEQSVADELFDTAVNMGTGIAAKFLQEALNLLNRNGKLWADIPEDGAIGNNTVSVANGVIEVPLLVKTLNYLQAARYIKICELDHTQEANFRGWINNRITA